jgi:Uma2 family endonuclease
MVTLPTELLEAPELALYEQQIKARLEEEQRLRHKFRDDLSAGLKAEFINGEVIMHSPATTRHTRVRMHLSRLLSSFVETRKLGLVLDEKALVCLTRNDYGPDVLFFGVDKAALIEPSQLLFPAPDFIAEVLSETTAHQDRGVKFRDYAAHGVTEYWLVDPQSEILEQYELVNAGYVLRLKSGSGHVRSFAVSGFEIPIRVIFNAEENLRCLRQLLQEPSA